jgi:hypothetical protein
LHSNTTLKRRHDENADNSENPSISVGRSR